MRLELKLIRPPSARIGPVSPEERKATIEASPALKRRERLLYDQSEQRLVRTLIAETKATPDDPMPRVMAALLTSVQWMLFQEFRARLLREESEPKIRAALLRHAQRAFEVLESGCGNYGRAKSARRART